MSGHDLYLVLRERLEAVADTVHIDTPILDEAQRARGLSHEGIARELHISEKTWRRWKAAGAIPTAQVDDVARVLRLDIERPPIRRVVLAEEATRLVSDEVVARLGALEARQGRVEALLRELLQRLPGAPDEDQALPG